MNDLFHASIRKVGPKKHKDKTICGIPLTKIEHGIRPGGYWNIWPYDTRLCCTEYLHYQKIEYLNTQQTGACPICKEKVEHLFAIAVLEGDLQ
jgi:hypothetical protein